MARKDHTDRTTPPASEQADLQTEQQLQSEFAKALSELNKGEHTAAALESGLDSIERKIEELLAQAEEHARQQKLDHTANGSGAKPEESGEEHQS